MFEPLMDRAGCTVEIREARRSAGRRAGGAERPARIGAESQTRSEALRERLRLELGGDRFARYFGQGASVALGEAGVDVVVTTPFMADLISRRCRDSLRRAAASVDGAEGREPEVRIRVERCPAPPEASPAPGAMRARPAPKRPRTTGAPSFRHSLDDFVVGEPNRVAHSAAVRVAEGVDDRAFSPLFLHSASGMGKTHLLEGIAARFSATHPGARIRYVTAESFTNDYITAIKSNTTDRFRRSWRNVKLLCLDDVHFLRNKQSTQLELLHTLDAIGVGDARIVLASDEHPRRIDQLGDHLVSRFMSGAVIRIDEPDDELRRRLIAVLAERRALRLTDDGVAELMQRAGAASVREIEGMLMQVGAVQRLAPDLCGGGTVLDGAAIRRSLGISDGAAKRAAGGPRRPVRLETIRDEVCRVLRLEPNDLFGSGRHKRVVLARGLIVRIARELTTLSFPDIAKGLKRPNHSTVITAHKRIQAQLDQGGPVGIGADLEGLTLADLIARARSRVLEAAGR